MTVLSTLLDLSVSQGTQAYAIALKGIGPPSSSVGGGKMRQRKSATAFAVARLISGQPELTISAPPLLFGRRPPQSNEKLTD